MRKNPKDAISRIREISNDTRESKQKKKNRSSAGIIPKEGRERDGVFRYRRMLIEMSHGYTPTRHIRTHLHTHTQRDFQKKETID